MNRMLAPSLIHVGRSRMVWTLALALCLAETGMTALGADSPTFERDVRPILKVYCIDCHGGGEKLEGGLDLRLKRFALQGGESGPVVVPGKSAESLLLNRIQSGEMPPGEKKVPTDKIAVIEAWIAAGAVAVREEPASLPPGIDITPEERAFWAFQPIQRREPPASAPDDRVRTPIDGFVLAKLKARQLSFSPDADKVTLIRRAAFDLTGLPPSQAEIETFISDTSELAYDKMLDRLLESPHYGERWGRHWLDVAGYADSEGNGADDTLRPYAYKYRDYVIRSFNADKPFDRFVLEQLAGDELLPRPWNNLTAEQIELLAATGYLRMVVDGTASGGDPAADSHQVVADALKVVGSSLLGLSVGCAQCHDHRYDPVPQLDYFRLRSIFEPAFDPAHWRRPGERLVSLYTDADRAKSAAVETEAQKMQQALNQKTQTFLATALEKELLKFPEAMRGQLRDAYQTPGDKRTEEQKQLLAANPSVNLSAGVLYQYDAAAAEELKKDGEKIAAKRAEKPREDFVSVLSELPGSIPPTHLFYRGDYRQPKQEVSPGDLTIAAPPGARLEIPADDPALPTSGRRIAFAKHLTNGRHPLVGRVLANRIWLHHFGRGIVDTPGDFGVLGLPPTHPELLDWLADEIPRQGWRLKGIHKLIMQSTVYRQQSATASAVSGSADSLSGDLRSELRRGQETRAEQGGQEARAESEGAERAAWYGRYPLRRLDAEVLRDRVLAVSGRLDRTPFGPPIPVEEDFVGQVAAKDNSARRSIYLQVRRTKPVSLLAAFDLPVMAVNCERRVNSTAAPQSLMLMNSDFVLKHAEQFAQRVRSETPVNFQAETASIWNSATDFHGPLGTSLAQQIAYAWQLAYQRPPTAEELDWGCQFVVQQIRYLSGAAEGAAATKTSAPIAESEQKAFTNLCQQLISSNEFLYVD